MGEHKIISKNVWRKLDKLSWRYCNEQNCDYDKFVDTFLSFISRNYINIDEVVIDCSKISIINDEKSNALSLSVVLDKDEMIEQLEITEEMVDGFEDWLNWLDRNTYVMGDNEYNSEYGYERSELDGCAKEDYRREFYEYMEEMEIY